MDLKHVIFSSRDVLRFGCSEIGSRTSWVSLNQVAQLKRSHVLVNSRGFLSFASCPWLVNLGNYANQSKRDVHRQIDDQEETSIVPKRLQNVKCSLPLPKPLSASDIYAAPKDCSKLRVSFKGLPGSYSEVVALKVFPTCKTVSCDEFEDAFKAVELWLADYAVLPIESSAGGSIHRNYDLLLRHRLHIVGEVLLAVDFCLLALPGVRMEQLKRVLSHPQALALSDIALSKLGVTRESVDDTAAAAQFVASKGLRDAGVIASARAADIYGLNILAERIQDDTGNITRFLILARDPIIPSNEVQYKTSIVFTLEEGPGVLFKALAVFSLRGISLTKIESRPQRKRPLRVVDDSNTGSAKYFDYLFYIDFEASMAEPRAQNALGNLQEFATFLRVLGCYPVDISS